VTQFSLKRACQPPQQLPGCCRNDLSRRLLAALDAALGDPAVFGPRAVIFTIDKQRFQHLPGDLPAFGRQPG